MHPWFAERDEAVLCCACANGGFRAHIQKKLLPLYPVSMTSIDFQLATSSDYEEIADVWHVSASLPGVGPVPMVPRETLRDRIEPEIANGWQITVARTGGQIVGFLAINVEAKVLSQLFVRPDFIGSGIGAHLLQLAMLQMPLGFTLSTASTNESARKFYEHWGLTLTGKGHHPRTGHSISFYKWAG